MSNNNYENVANVNATRPQQVLLVGLGGVGSRTVDHIMSIMPAQYKRYTKAIAIDTDLGELSSRLPNIPIANKIALGSNPENGQKITVGEYIRNNPETLDWFIQGDRLDLIESRNTSQGAKQIRMVSRVALEATDSFCKMDERLRSIVHDFNHADGASDTGGLFVMVIASIAGGTGAGTVLQVPLFLEKALSGSFSEENIQIECSMLLPNMFAKAQDAENYRAAKANAYAVIRELMSVNAKRISRKDLIGSKGVKARENNKMPYSRVLFFDDLSMAGESVNGSIDEVYVPMTAEAINQYLFGPVSGKIVSALDNTLSRLYGSNGETIFTSVGNAKLKYPRGLYIQYATGKWVSKAVSESWMDIDKETKKDYLALRRQAQETGTKRPDEKTTRRRLYCQVVDEKRSAFYQEIKENYFYKEDNTNLADNSDDSTLNNYEDILEEFWDRCDSYLRNKVGDDAKISLAKANLSRQIQAKGSKYDAMFQTMKSLERGVDDFVSLGIHYEMEVMRPSEAKNNHFYVQKDNDKPLFTFLKSKKLHPIMLRYFLYKLQEKAQSAAILDGKPKLDEDITKVKRRSDFIADANDYSTKAISSAEDRVVAEFAKALLKDLEEYIEEIEGMFNSLGEIVSIFDEKSEKSLSMLSEFNRNPRQMLAGGPLSMMYSWNKVEEMIGAEDDSYTIDDDLNLQLHEIVYRAFIDQVASIENVNITGKRIRVRTKYEVVIKEELEKYYKTKLSESFESCFPRDVIEAALLECGLVNAYKDAKTRVDSIKEYTVEEFMRTRANMINYGEGEYAPEGQSTDVQCLNALLAATVSKSKPYCGRVEGDPITNRLMTVNVSLLREELTGDINEDGVSTEKLNKAELIPGVTTASIGATGLNTQFVTEGLTRDEILFVMTLAGMNARDFIAFVPPDDDKHAPNKAESYYMAYKDILDEISIGKPYITPHLHREWHLVDKLVDLSSDHTNSYNREAAKAFVYGFAFDLIRVIDGGIVEIGALNEESFIDVFEGSSFKQFILLDPNVHAVVDTFADREKKGTLDSILVKVFELLATSDPIRKAILKYAEKKLSEYTVQRSPQFILNCLNSENVDNYSYSCILDVIDGYYQGTRQLSYNESNRGEKNTEYMFNFLLEETFETCKIFTTDLAQLRTLYQSVVGKYYLQAVCDEPEMSAAEIETVTDEFGIFASITSVTGTKSTAKSKPFERNNGRYRESVAIAMVDKYISNN